MIPNGPARSLPACEGPAATATSPPLTDPVGILAGEGTFARVRDERMSYLERPAAA
jgi:hypothetical protein